MTTNEAITAAAVARWQAGDPITDGQARVIASDWYGGEMSPLYSFTSTGNTMHDGNTDALMREIHACVELAPLGDEEGLLALATYVERVGNRGPVPRWSQLWG